MDYRTLGTSDLTVSQICLGTMTWGEQNTMAEAHAQMDMARDRGVNFLDTAELYATPPNPGTQGRTEEIIGHWLQARGNRDQMIIATKVVGRSPMAWHRGNRVEETRPNRTQIREAVEGSLKRLQTDYIDLYQVHWPDRAMSNFGGTPTIFKNVSREETSLAETLETLDELVKAGKVRAIGLSNESPWGTMSYLHLAEKHGWARVQSVQNAYNLLNRTYEAGMAEVGMREQVGLLAYAPLATGLLTGKYRDGAKPDGARRTLFDLGDRYSNPQVEPAVDAYCTLAKEHGLKPADMALAFVNSRPFLGATIIGATNLAQLEANLDACNVTISEELEEAINAIHLTYCNPAP